MLLYQTPLRIQPLAVVLLICMFVFPHDAVADLWNMRLVKVGGLEFFPHAGDWGNPNEWDDPDESDNQTLPGPGDIVVLESKKISNRASITLDIVPNVGSVTIRSVDTNQLGGDVADANVRFNAPGNSPQDFFISGSLKIESDAVVDDTIGGPVPIDFGNTDVTLNNIQVNAGKVLVSRSAENTDGRSTLTVNDGSVLGFDEFKLTRASLALHDRADAWTINSQMIVDSNSTVYSSPEGNSIRGGGVHNDNYILLDDVDDDDPTVHTTIEGPVTGSGRLILGNRHDLYLRQEDPEYAGMSVISGKIEGSGSLWVMGELNTVQLRGSNTFTGDINVLTGATLNIARGANLGAIGKELSIFDGTLQAGGNFTIGIPVFINDATIDTQAFNVGASQSWTGPSGTITKVGIGVLELNNNAAGYRGNWVVNEGILESADGDTFANDTTVTVNDPGTLRFTGNENFGAVNGTGLMSIRDNTVKLYKGDASFADFAGRVAGSGVIEKVAGSDGLQRFSGNNTAFTGTWLVNGAMAFASADSLHRPAQIGSSGALVLDPSSGDSTYTAEITGGETSRIHKRGGGSFTLDNYNANYFGSYEVVEGTLKFDTAPNAFASEFAHVVITENGTLSTNKSSIQLLLPVNIAQDGASIDTADGQIILNGAHGGLEGSGTLHKRGTGTLNIFTASPDFTGGVHVREGLFRYSRHDMLEDAILQIDSGATVTGIQAGTTSYVDYQVGELSGGGTLEIPTMQSVSVGEGNDSGYTFSGKLTGNGRFVKVGTGSMTLSGDNRQFGGDFIAANGALRLSSLNALPDGSGLEIQQAGTAEVVVESRASKLQGNGLLRITGGRMFVGINDASSTFDGQLAGSRELWKTGAGTLTLTGNQIDYDGAYVVTGGLLHLANTHPSAIPQITMQGGGIRAGGDITLSKTVSSNGGSIDTNGFDVDVTGSLFGNSPLVKRGSGALRLLDTGNNLQSTLVVEEGSVVLVNERVNSNINTSFDIRAGAVAKLEAERKIRALAGAGTLDFGSNDIWVGDSTSTTFSGKLAGTGEFTYRGTGQLMLTGNNRSYAGDVVVDAGTLRLDGALGSNLFTINRNATLISGDADTFTNASVVQVNDGTLRLEGDENFGALNGAGVIEMNGRTLRTGYESSFSYHYAGSIVGDGQFVKNGTGALSFSGDNSSFTGSWLLNSGLLRVTKGESLATDIAMGAGSILEFSITPHSSYDGSISGDGEITKKGFGRIILSGDSSDFGGVVTISRGELRVNGALGGSNVTLQSGTTLSGSGEIAGPVLVESGGTVSPGSSPGLLTMDSLTLSGGAEYQLEIAGALSGQFDSLLVEGDAAINGNLDVSLIDGYFPMDGDILMVMEVLGQLSGQFANYSEGDLVADLAHPTSASGLPSTQLYITYAGGDGNDIVLYATTTVPEPSTMSLLAIWPALLCLHFRRAR